MVAVRLIDAGAGRTRGGKYRSGFGRVALLLSLALLSACDSPNFGDSFEADDLDRMADLMPGGGDVVPFRRAGSDTPNPEPDR